MLQRIKQGDYWLYKFTMNAIFVVMVVSFWVAIRIVYGMSEEYWFIPVLGGIVVCIGLYLNYFISGLFYLVACDKGYDSIVFSRVPYFLGMVGYLLVIALPNRGDVDDNNDETSAS